MFSRMANCLQRRPTERFEHVCASRCKPVWASKKVPTIGPSVTAQPVLPSAAKSAPCRKLTWREAPSIEKQNMHTNQPSVGSVCASRDCSVAEYPVCSLHVNGECKSSTLHLPASINHFLATCLYMKDKTGLPWPLKQKQNLTTSLHNGRLQNSSKGKKEYHEGLFHMLPISLDD